MDAMDGTDDTDTSNCAHEAAKTLNEAAASWRVRGPRFARREVA
jgi:hypothetical protein